MNNIIICEGSTDYVLLQYYMRKAYQWSDDPSRQSGILKMPRQKSRNLVKDSNILTVIQNILKNVEWEKYNNIQTAFQKLGEL